VRVSQEVDGGACVASSNAVSDEAERSDADGASPEQDCRWVGLPNGVYCASGVLESTDTQRTTLSMTQASPRNEDLSARVFVWGILLSIRDGVVSTLVDVPDTDGFEYEATELGSSDGGETGEACLDVLSRISTSSMRRRHRAPRFAWTMGNYSYDGEARAGTLTWQDVVLDDESETEAGVLDGAVGRGRGFDGFSGEGVEGESGSDNASITTRMRFSRKAFRATVRAPGFGDPTPSLEGTFTFVGPPAGSGVWPPVTVDDATGAHIVEYEAKRTNTFKLSLAFVSSLSGRRQPCVLFRSPTLGFVLGTLWRVCFLFGSLAGQRCFCSSYSCLSSPEPGRSRRRGYCRASLPLRRHASLAHE